MQSADRRRDLASDAAAGAARRMASGVGPANPSAFTTVGTWRNKGNDIEIGGKTYYWSKHVNFAKVLDVAARAGQPIELSTDLDSGPDYERAIAGGFTFRPVVPMSLDIDDYRDTFRLRAESLPCRKICTFAPAPDGSAIGRYVISRRAGR